MTSPRRPWTDASWPNTIDAAQYVELDAAHLSNIEAAAPFTAALLAFLNA